MKFRNPETGEVFDTIIEALKRYCQDHPKELLILMNYDEVEDEPSGNPGKLKEANMDKPLKDWTLGEVQKYCKITKCGDCSISSWCDSINKGIEDWDLDEKPRFTEQDVEDAKAVKRVFGRDGTVKRLNKAITDPYSNLTFDNIYINESMFPCIFEGQSYTLDEIIGGADNA